MIIYIKFFFWCFSNCNSLIGCNLFNNVFNFEYFKGVNFFDRFGMLLFNKGL